MQTDPLREATRQFESVFIARMLEGMRRTATTAGGALPAGQGEELFRSMLDQEIAGQVARTPRGMGIGEMLYRQLATGNGTEEPKS